MMVDGGRRVLSQTIQYFVKERGMLNTETFMFILMNHLRDIFSSYKIMANLTLFKCNFVLAILCLNQVIVGSFSDNDQNEASS